MIQTRDELNYYITCDLRSRFGEGFKLSLPSRISAIFLPKPWKFQILLRKAEFYCSQRSRLLKMTLGTFYKFRAYRYGFKCGFTVPLFVFGPGLCLGHVGTIVINGGARFGSNARIQAGVNVGAFSRFDENHTDDACPTFGDNVYIGPGAKIFGPISIGDNVAIGANAVISKSAPSHCTVVGVNKIVNSNGSIDMIRYGDKKCIPADSFAFRTSMQGQQINE